MKNIMCKFYNSRTELIYCPLHDDGTEPTSEEIIKCIEEEFVGKFNKDEYEYSDKKPLNNDDNTYITKDRNLTYVWKVYDKVADINNTSISGLYYIRRIGIIVELERD